MNSDSDKKVTNKDFGSVLAEARKAKNYSIDEVSEYLKIPDHIITAIEKSDIDVLPAPTYAQGYIRAYAKFLELSEVNVLDIYSRAVPHDLTAKLKPRSKLPDEANSQSPLVKTVTIFLIVAGIIAVIYGSFQYYQEKAVVMESELVSENHRFTGNSLDSPGAQGLTIKQDARITSDDELIVEDSAALETMDDITESGMVESGTVEADMVEADKAESDMMTELTEPSEVAVLQTEAEESQQVAENEAAKNDVIEIYAEKGTWLEVYDASNTRLFYNMLSEGSSKLLMGQAPFRISLGNAKTTQMSVNNIEIDMTKFIRSNNTASFSVSTEEKNVIFH